MCAPKWGQILPVMISKILGKLRVFPLRKEIFYSLTKPVSSLEFAEEKLWKKRSSELCSFASQMVLSNNCVGKQGKKIVFNAKEVK